MDLGGVEPQLPSRTVRPEAARAMLLALPERHDADEQGPVDNASLTEWLARRRASVAEAFTDGLGCFRCVEAAREAPTVSETTRGRAVAEAAGALCMSVVRSNFKRAFGGVLHATRSVRTDAAARSRWRTDSIEASNCARWRRARFCLARLQVSSRAAAPRDLQLCSPRFDAKQEHPLPRVQFRIGNCGAIYLPRHAGSHITRREKPQDPPTATAITATRTAAGVLRGNCLGRCTRLQPQAACALELERYQNTLAHHPGRCGFRLQSQSLRLEKRSHWQLPAHQVRQQSQLVMRYIFRWTIDQAAT